MASSKMSAALCAAFAVPATAFVSPAGISQQQPSLRAATADLGQAASREQTQCTVGATAALFSGALAAAAVAGSVSRRRGAVERRVFKEPQPVFMGNVEVVKPGPPNSEETLQTYIGADVETGDEPWDPLGFSKLYDRNYDFNMVMVYPHVQWLREAEIKHGRVCMLAFVGMVMQQFIHIPGLPVEPDWTKALDACYVDKVASLGIVQISVFCMLVEGKYSPHYAWLGTMDREPGDLGFDPLKLTKKPGFDLAKKQLSELKNGRLAMIGVASMAANHLIPGSVPLLTGSY